MQTSEETSGSFDHIGPYAANLQRGLGELAALVLPTQAGGQSTSPETDLADRLWGQNLMVLATTPCALLKVICHGNLELAQKTDSDVQEDLRYVSRGVASWPSFYMVELVDRDTGVAPSAYELKEILACANEYVHGNDAATAFQIDSSKHTTANFEDAQVGLRCYPR